VYEENSPLTNVPLEELASHPNLAELLEEKVLVTIGNTVVEDYDTDERSRIDWLARYERNLKLATQIPENKSYPWPNASNVKYPLLLNAGLQFHARAYPALIPAAGIVTGKVVGKDEDGMKRDRAERISAHMSYQLLDEMDGWEEGMDRLLITLPFTGTEFKKTYFDPERGHNVSEHVYAKDLVVNYYAKTLDSAPRITEILSYSKNELIEKHRSGLFLECKAGSPGERRDVPVTIQEQSKGITPPSVNDSDKPYVVLEQHRYYDLDGDGYKEPYICTVERDTKQVLRVVAAYYPNSILRNEDNQVVFISRINYYTLFQFIPNPAGGIYGIGFGDLIGPLNHSVDTLINQLTDAGTLSNLQPGFISRNLRIKGGTYRFQPGEWKNVNASGQDIKQGLFPLPIREPSATLFSLLQFLVSAGERVSSTTDLQVGENPGQNQKVGTTQIVQANGMKVFTAIYKRIRKALESEFKKLFALNGLYLNPQEYFAVVNPTQRDLQYINIQLTDYQEAGVNIVPSADPHLASQELKLARAQYLAGLMVMGGFNEYEIKRRLVAAGDIERPDEVLPPPDSPNAPKPPPNPDMLTIQLEAMKEDNAEREREFRRNFDTEKLRVDAAAKNIELRIKDKDAESKAIKAHGDVVNKAADNAVKARKVSNDQEAASSDE
jgi:chaperonin GroES